MFWQSAAGMRGPARWPLKRAETTSRLVLGGIAQAPVPASRGVRDPSTLEKRHRRPVSRRARRGPAYPSNTGPAIALISADDHGVSRGELCLRRRGGVGPDARDTRCIVQAPH